MMDPLLSLVERLRRPVAFQSEGAPVITTGNGADAERVLGAVSVAFAALAALAVTALILVLLAKRRYGFSSNVFASFN